MTRYPTLFRWSGCLLTSGVIVAFVLAVVVLWTTVQPGCTHVVIERLPSPDGSWVAVIDEYTCDVGLFSTDITAEVHLLTTKPPLQDIDLLGVDTGGNADERPRLVWSAPNMLRVTVPVQSFLKVLTRHAEGVQVDVHFDPDDPVARAAWLKQTGLPPDPADDPAKR
jgi:hypothetical protein